jgi:HSP20 family protein
VDVTVDDGVLTLRGEKKSEHQDKDRGWSERYYGRFERSIVLPVAPTRRTARACYAMAC